MTFVCAQCRSKQIKNPDAVLGWCPVCAIFSTDALTAAQQLKYDRKRQKMAEEAAARVKEQLAYAEEREARRQLELEIAAAAQAFYDKQLAKLAGSGPVVPCGFDTEEFGAVQDFALPREYRELVRERFALETMSTSDAVLDPDFPAPADLPRIRRASASLGSSSPSRR